MRTTAVRVGRLYWFEYHCNESDESDDASAWRRSHERVRVMGVVDPGGAHSEVKRAEIGHQRIFRARWSDGFEWDVFEDELLSSPEDFQRPDPPRAHGTKARISSSGA